MTGGASIFGKGGGGAMRMGDMTCRALSRNSEYNLWRAMKINPTSFPRASKSPTIDVSSEYQTIVCELTEEALLISFGKRTSGMIMPEANVITNHGMICTKVIVFNVAMFVFLEVSPIHIPNQVKAQMLARNVRVPTPEMAMDKRSLEAPNGPTETVVIRPLAPVVVITVIFVVVDLVGAVVGGGDLAAIRLVCAR